MAFPNVDDVLRGQRAFMAHADDLIVQGNRPTRCSGCGAKLQTEPSLYGPRYGCNSPYVWGHLVPSHFCLERERDQWEMAAFCEKKRAEKAEADVGRLQFENKELKDEIEDMENSDRWND